MNIPPPEENRESQEILLSSIIDFVRFHMKRRNIPDRYFDDLLGAAQIGYADACRRYSPKKDAHFSTYAKKRIFGEMMEELRRQDPLSRRMRQKVKVHNRVITLLVRRKMELNFDSYIQILKAKFGETNKVVWEKMWTQFGPTMISNESIHDTIYINTGKETDLSEINALSMLRRDILVKINKCIDKVYAGSRNEARNIDVCRSVLIDGKKPSFKAKQYGIHPGRVSQILKKVKTELSKSDDFAALLEESHELRAD